MRVEEGTFGPGGMWVTTRVWNGDQTDYGLNFTATPVLLRFFVSDAAAVLFLILTVLVWIKHSGNIARLRAGTEPKIGSKTATTAPPGA